MESSGFPVAFSFSKGHGSVVMRRGEPAFPPNLWLSALTNWSLTSLKWLILAAWEQSCIPGPPPGQKPSHNPSICPLTRTLPALGKKRGNIIDQKIRRFMLQPFGGSAWLWCRRLKCVEDVTHRRTNRRWSFQQKLSVRLLPTNLGRVFSSSEAENQYVWSQQLMIRLEDFLKYICFHMSLGSREIKIRW